MKEENISFVVGLLRFKVYCYKAFIRGSLQWDETWLSARCELANGCLETEKVTHHYEKWTERNDDTNRRFMFISARNRSCFVSDAEI